MREMMRQSRITTCLPIDAVFADFEDKYAEIVCRRIGLSVPWNVCQKAEERHNHIEVVDPHYLEVSSGAVSDHLFACTLCRPSSNTSKVDHFVKNYADLVFRSIALIFRSVLKVAASRYKSAPRTYITRVSPQLLQVASASLRRFPVRVLYHPRMIHHLLILVIDTFFTMFDEPPPCNVALCIQRQGSVISDRRRPSAKIGNTPEADVIADTLLTVILDCLPLFCVGNVSYEHENLFIFTASQILRFYRGGSKTGAAQPLALAVAGILWRRREFKSFDILLTEDLGAFKHSFAILNAHPALSLLPHMREVLLAWSGVSSMDFVPSLRFCVREPSPESQDSVAEAVRNVHAQGIPILNSIPYTVSYLTMMNAIGMPLRNSLLPAPINASALDDLLISRLQRGPCNFNYTLRTLFASVITAPVSVYLANRAETELKLTVQHAPSDFLNTCYRYEYMNSDRSLGLRHTATNMLGGNTGLESVRVPPLMSCYAYGGLSEDVELYTSCTRPLASILLRLIPLDGKLPIAAAKVSAKLCLDEICCHRFQQFLSTVEPDEDEGLADGMLTLNHTRARGAISEVVWKTWLRGESLGSKESLFALQAADYSKAQQLLTSPDGVDKVCALSNEYVNASNKTLQDFIDENDKFQSKKVAVDDTWIEHCAETTRYGPFMSLWIDMMCICNKKSNQWSSLSEIAKLFSVSIQADCATKLQDWSTLETTVTSGACVREPSILARDLDTLGKVPQLTATFSRNGPTSGPQSGRYDPAYGLFLLASASEVAAFTHDVLDVGNNNTRALLQTISGAMWTGAKTVVNSLYEEDINRPRVQALLRLQSLVETSEGLASVLQLVHEFYVRPLLCVGKAEDYRSTCNPLFTRVLNVWRQRVPPSYVGLDCLSAVFVRRNFLSALLGSLTTKWPVSASTSVESRVALAVQEMSWTMLCFVRASRRGFNMLEIAATLLLRIRSLPPFTSNVVSGETALAALEKAKVLMVATSLNPEATSEQKLSMWIAAHNVLCSVHVPHTLFATSPKKVVFPPAMIKLIDSSTELAEYMRAQQRQENIDSEPGLPRHLFVAVLLLKLKILLALPNSFICLLRPKTLSVNTSAHVSKAIDPTLTHMTAEDVSAALADKSRMQNFFGDLSYVPGHPANANKLISSHAWILSHAMNLVMMCPTHRGSWAFLASVTDQMLLDLKSAPNRLSTLNRSSTIEETQTAESVPQCHISLANVPPDVKDRMMQEIYNIALEAYSTLSYLK